MRILMIGDVVGGPGRRMLQQHLKTVRAERGLGAVVVNAENCAAGSGITAALAEEIFAAGVDAITLATTRGGRRSSPARSGASRTSCAPRTCRRRRRGRGGRS